MVPRKWRPTSGGELFRVSLAFTKLNTNDLLYLCDVVSFSRQNYTVSGLCDSDATSFSFHTIQGCTYKAFQNGIRQPHQADLIMILCILLEVVNWLHQRFLKCASLARRTAHRLAGKPAPVCEFCWRAESPVTLVHDYLSLLSSGQATRLRLLWGRSFTSFNEWAAAKPEMLTVLRRGIATLDLWLFLRLTRVLCRFPYTLALLPHDTVPDAEKKEILEQAFAPLPDNREAMEDPLDEYFTRKLVDRFNDEGIDKDELLDPNSIWSVAIRMWSWTIMLTVALIEFAHGRGRARCKKGGLWASFVE